MKKIALLISFIVAGLVSHAQYGNDSTKYTWYKYVYGVRYNRMRPDLVLDVPKDTIYSKDGLATKAGHLWRGDGTKWSLVGEGTVTGSHLDPAKIWIGNIDSLAQPLLISGAITINNLGQAELETVNASPATSSALYKITTDKYGRVLTVTSVSGSDLDGIYGFHPYDASNPAGYINHSDIPDQNFSSGLTALDTTTAILGGRLTRYTSISGVNLYTLKLDSFLSSGGHGLIINLGGDQPGDIMYRSTDGTLRRTDALNFDSANHKLTVDIGLLTGGLNLANNTTGGTALGITANVNGFPRIAMSNSNSGVSAATGFTLTNDASHGTQLYMGSTGNAYAPDGFLFRNTGSGRSTINISGGQLNFSYGVMTGVPSSDTLFTFLTMDQYGLRLKNITMPVADTNNYKPLVMGPGGYITKMAWVGGGGGSGIADPGGSNNDFLQKKSGSWTNRTIAQVQTDLGVDVLTEQTLTDGATITWDVSQGANAVVTIGATGRTLSITNAVANHTYTVRIIQGSGGSKTITTWPGTTKWPGGVAIPLSTAASAEDIVTFYAVTSSTFRANYGNNYQ